MEIPQLYRQLEDQLRQYVLPKDPRHLQGYAEAVAAISQSGSACVSHWLPFLDHRDCCARAHMGWLSYLVLNHAAMERAGLMRGDRSRKWRQPAYAIAVPSYLILSKSVTLVCTTP